jgi:hypothetical protein
MTLGGGDDAPLAFLWVFDANHVARAYDAIAARAH